MDPKERYYELKLPSRLIPYKIDGVAKIEIRYIKGKDQKILDELTLANFEKKFAIVLEGLIHAVGADGNILKWDPTKLTLGDRLYIAIWLAVHCESSIYPVDNAFCKTCLSFSDIEVDLKIIEKSSVELPEAFAEPYDVKLSDNKVVKLRLYRVLDRIVYLDYVQAKKEDNTLYWLALSMVDDKKINERMTWLNELSSDDILRMKAFHETYDHGVAMKATFKCPVCGGSGVTPVPFLPSILSPAGKLAVRSHGGTV